MTRRLFAWLVVLAMVLSLVPAITVSAEGEDTHTDHAGWTEWTDTTKLPTAAGKYCLQVDVDLTAAWVVPTGQVHLCLNGHKVTQTGTDRLIVINGNRELSIYDCAKAYDAEGNYVGGLLTGGQSTHGSAVWVARNGGVFNLYGGRISGCKIASGEYGAAVYLQSGKMDGTKKLSGGVFNLYGGEIVGCGVTEGQYALGGAVYLHGESTNRCDQPATFNMYGGTLSGNYAKAGGAVYGVQDAVINIQGGVIENNTASGSGGGIYGQDNVVITVANATVRGNKATNAGAIYGQTKTQITLRDSVITGNKTTGTNAEGWCAAVYMTGSGSKMTLGGELYIYDNTMGNAQIPDLYLNSSSGADIEKLYVDGLEGGYVRFGVHDKTVTEASDVVFFAGENKTFSTGALGYLEGTQEKRVGLVDGSFRFVEGHFHLGEYYALWNDSTKLPSSGNYCLNTDVTLANYDSKAKVTGGKTLTLCMNGHTIDNKSNSAVQETFRVENGSLYLGDCTTKYDENGNFVSGGKITGGKKAGNGAVIYANNAASVIEVEGIAFVGNESTETNVNFGGAVVQLRKNTTPARFVGCLFSENISAGGGGAIALRESGAVYLENCVLTGNRASSGGAIFITGGSAELKNCDISGNTATGSTGAIVMLNSAKLKLTGKTVVYDNLDQNGDQRNLHLQTGSAMTCDVTGLTGGAKVGVNLHTDRIAGGHLFFSTAMTENPGFCVSDDPAYTVALDDQNRLALEEMVVIRHNHTLCNDADCTAHGETLSFLPWDKADSLPTSGNYYLEQDVTLTAATTISSELNLCLNGHTVTQTKTARVFYLSQNAKLNLTDCGESGKIQGGKDDTGAMVYVDGGAQFSLYAGRLTGSSPASDKAGSGAAIFLRSSNSAGATFNMYGGEITGNGGAKSWGGAVTNGSGNASNTVYVNIYGGKISGNRAGTGGAIRLEKKAVLTLSGGEISNNTATTGGAIYLAGAAELRLQGGAITGNTATTGAGIYMSAASKLTVSGAPTVYDNTASGKQNNLYLADSAIITLGDVSKAAKIGVTATNVGRVISTVTETDLSANFVGDSSKNPVLYKDNALWIDFYSDHQHCVCDGVTGGTCDHTVKMWMPWESGTTLPTTAGYYYLTKDVELTKYAHITQGQVHLCLNGRTVKAAEGDRHILLDSGASLTITDCNETAGGFTGGSMEYGGSVNAAAGSVLNLYAGKFYGNAAPGSEGGALYLRGGNGEHPGAIFNMYGGEISGNTAKNGAGVRVMGLNTGGTVAGGMKLYGGSIRDNHADGSGGGVHINAQATLDIYGGQIADNSAETTGGGIFATGKGTAVTMEGGALSGNRSANGGGLITQSDSSFTLNAGGITGNTASKNGGGAYISINTVFTVNGGQISGNAANNGGGFNALRSTVTLNGGEITGNTGKTSAGAFRAEGATVVVNQVTVSGNSAPDGGAAYVIRASSGSGESIVYYPSTVTVNEGARITGNTAKDNGGAFLIANDGVVMTINGGEISQNTAKNGGGFMCWRGSTLYLKGGKISGNTTEANGGGGYVSSGAVFQMTGGTVSGNRARNAGGIYFLRTQADLVGGSISGNLATPKITWKDGKENKDGGNGGGIFISGAKVNLRGTAITGNTADVNGGGIVMSRASQKVNGVTVFDLVTVNIYGGTFSGNTAKNAAGGMLIQSEGTVVNMYGGTFTNNTAKNAGGVYVSTKTLFNMQGGAIINNRATASAGGVYVLNSTANITGGQLYGNRADTQAGFLAASGETSVVRLKDVKIHDHTAKTYGAVFMTSKATLYAENCDFYNNAAETGDTGAVSVGSRCKGELTNCKFYNNSAGTHAGAFIAGTFAQVTLTNCDFTENRTGKLGGAFYTNPASQVTVTGTTFRENTAGERGGAITCRGNLFLTDCTLEDNIATMEGGAVYTDTNAANGSGVMRGLVIEGSRIRNNTAGGVGGAFYVYKGCRLELHDSEVTGNVSPLEGGAIWAYEDVELHNTKITGNGSGGEGYAVYMNDANYDGHSYFTSRNKLSGNVIIRDNQGGDLYMGPDVFFAITAEGLGQDTYMEVTLDSGVLTQRILGAYHYEGENQVYTVTYGDKSMTDPEFDPSLPGDRAEESQPRSTGDVLLYALIGVIGLAAIGAAVLIAMKKKKSAPAEKN